MLVPSPFLRKAVRLAAPCLLLASLLGAAEQKSLFDGKELAGWRSPTGAWGTAKRVSLDPAEPKKLAVEEGAGVLVNGTKGPTVDLVTQEEFGDVEAHLEFCIPSKSNSGVYFMGRYEIQVYDSYGVAKDAYPGIECGGIYPRWVGNHELEGHPPRVNASKPPGQWQTFDIIFRAPRFDATGKKTENAKFIKVVHNGQVVHENVEVTGPTRAAIYEDEKPLGPIMLQGDHGPVAYRKLRVKAVEIK